jgi:pimeloyl-ACP methyl ester carboxylesterase
MPHVWRLLMAPVLALALSAGAKAADRWDTVPEPQPLPRHLQERTVEHDGVRIWYATVGRGSPVILLHGGDSSSDLWGDQVPALVAARHRVILIDSRAQGRSTWDGRPLHYETMADDVLAVMNALHLRRSAFVGWSDGAIISLILAMDAPERVTRVYAFGANMDLSGFNFAGALAPTLRLSKVLLERNYARVSPTPDNWKSVSAAVFDMQLREPTYSADDLAAINGPKIAIVDGDHDEFITRAHTEYLARTISGAQLILLEDVGHFAPLQDPEGFNRSMLQFLGR